MPGPAQPAADSGASERAPTREPGGVRLAAFLIGDSALCVCIGYLAVREALLRSALVTTRGRFAAWLAVLGIVLAASIFAWFRHRWSGRRGPAAIWVWSLAEILGAALVLVALPFVAYRHGDPSPYASVGGAVARSPWRWLVTDWLLKAGDLAAFILASPFEWMGLVALHLLMVWIAFGRGRRRSMAALLGVMWVPLLWRATRLVEGESLNLFVVLFVPAPLAAAGAMALGFPRAAGRAQAAALVGWFVGATYLGDFPVKGWLAHVTDPRVTRLHPCPDGVEGFPTRFSRDLWVDPPQDRVYVSYGPSSGVVALRLSDGCLVARVRIPGTIRKLWSATGEPFLYGADDNASRLYVLRKDSLRIEREVDLASRDGVADAWRVFGDAARRRLYVLHYDRPVLTELDLDTLEPARSFDFSSRPGVELPAAMMAMALGERPGLAFVVYGPVDLDHRWRVVSFDLERFIVTGERELPRGSIAIEPRLEHGVVYTPGAWSPTLVEIDAATLATRRILPGARFALTITSADDPWVVAAVSPIEPTLRLTCGADASLAASYSLGSKLMAAHYVPEIHAIVAASARGVFRIDLATLKCPPGS